jgi:hypothetical protein
MANMVLLDSASNLHDYAPGGLRSRDLTVLSVDEIGLALDKTIHVTEASNDDAPMPDSSFRPLLFTLAGGLTRSPPTRAYRVTRPWRHAIPVP